MKISHFILAAVLSAGTVSTVNAELMTMLNKISFIGPRAGVSIVPEETRSSEGSNPINSLFGWVLDIRYTSEQNFEGYAEGGLFLEGIERGVIFPETWGYFGVRQKQGFGIGLGPSFSFYGIGLGIAPAYSFRIDRIMIPVTFNTVFTNGDLRYQAHVGFSYGSR
jgi:hypothetical protein